MAEMTFIAMYIIALTVSAVSMFLTGSYSGELAGFQLGISSFELLILFLVTAVGYVIIFQVYCKTKKKKFYIEGIKLEVISARLNVFFFVLVCANIAFTLKTNVGIVGSEAESPYSTLFAPLKVETLFLLFYVFCREASVSRILFWSNVVIFSAFMLIKGWTGFLLLIAMLELYFYFRGKRLSLLIKLTLTFGVPLLLFLAGGIVYKHAYEYKFEVRGLGNSEITYGEGIDKLTSRLTFFPISVGVYEKSESVKMLYSADDIPFKELKGSVRQLVPRLVMQEKEFRSLNNNSKRAFMPGLSAKTSNDIGVLMYGLTLFSISFIEGALWLGISISAVVILKVVFDLLEERRGQTDILYFLTLLSLYNSASLEAAFGNSYAYFVFIIPVLLILRVIVIRRSGVGASKDSY